MSETAIYPSLRGRSVFITGGASGIGSALVEAFHQQGSLVGFVDTDDKSATALQEKLEGANSNARPWFRRVDVTNVVNLKTA
ncbi:MAG TPA: SDR family NAD(P)-dependent oxidoreductase, partial [Hellea balneolensis]|nr:SDR family NAD(P)-dependent oxidoreductase [Hellea balneolensis]